MKKSFLISICAGVIAAGINTAAMATPSYDTVVDLMVVYTQEARARYEQGSGTTGDDAIKAKVVSTVAWMNRALEKSETKTRVNLVWPHEVNYTGHNSYASIWDSFDNGELKQVQTDRDQAGADLTVIIFDDSGESGQAPYSRQTAILRNPVTRLFSHEVGHLFGTQHGYTSGSVPVENSNYDKGYQFVGSDGVTYVTLMAWSYATGESIQNYSNPSVNHAGVPTGISNDRDNAREIRGTRSSRSALRELKPWRSDSKWELINRNVGESLTTVNGSPWNGTRLILGDQGGDQLAYQWNFTPVSSGSTKYYIQPEQNSSKGIKFNTSPGILEMWSISNTSSKRWRLNNQDNGFYRIRSDVGGVVHFMAAEQSGGDWDVIPDSSIPILAPDKYLLEWELREAID